jgi:hypothetical protein
VGWGAGSPSATDTLPSGAKVALVAGIPALEQTFDDGHRRRLALPTFRLRADCEAECGQMVGFGHGRAS